MNYFDYTFTDSAQKAVRLAEQLAHEYSHSTYGAEHLLHSVVYEDVGLHPLLSQLHVDSSSITRWALNRIEKTAKSVRYVEIPPANESSLSVFKETKKLCLRYGKEEISPLEILEALITPDVGFGADLLRRLPIALYEIIDWRKKNVDQLFSSDDSAKNVAGKGTANFEVSSLQVLEKYCDDLTVLAREGKIDPLIGRDRELKELVEILGKRISPNVLIVGESGVGKTAMVGGLALNIINDDVPEKLKSASIFELDVSGRLVAGAYKGEVEERLKSVLKAVKSYEGKAILFIDEIHILLDDKGPVGSGVVNLLKPELARGELTVIGITTQREYQQFIEKDSAFNRRFSRITIAEPDEILAAKMLKGLMSKYEEFHGLKVRPEAITHAVKLTKKYIREKLLPLSAIELIDFALACAVQMNTTSLKILKALEEKWETMGREAEDELREIARNRLSELLISKLGDEEDYGNQDFGDILKKLSGFVQAPKGEIEEDDISSMMAYRTGIPMGRLRSKEQEKFKNIKETLQKRVVGQDHVLEEVANALKAFRANLKDPKEPGAVFFFTGPTGTGKTELAKAIAELLFDDEDALIRFDMSEFQEKQSVASLLGASPGYIGYERGGLLINKVRTQPYSVVLFDEIEKADKDIYGIFLQMLTDSRLTDKQGKMADFSNAIIIFTSNAGAHEIVDVFNSGTEPTSEQLKAILRRTKAFKDEFLGRVDSQILPFAPISEEVARLILNIHFKKFAKILLQQHNVSLTASETLIEHFITIGFSPLYGARPLRNAIKSFLTPPIADKIILGEITNGDKVNLDLDEEKNLVWNIEKAEILEIKEKA